MFHSFVASIAYIQQIYLTFLILISDRAFVCYKATSTDVFRDVQCNKSQNGEWRKYNVRTWRRNFFIGQGSLKAARLTRKLFSVRVQ
jgi:hypothetical protein